MLSIQELEAQIKDAKAFLASGVTIPAVVKALEKTIADNQKKIDEAVNQRVTLADGTVATAGTVVYWFELPKMDQLGHSTGLRISFRDATKVKRDQAGNRQGWVYFGDIEKYQRGIEATKLYGSKEAAMQGAEAEMQKLVTEKENELLTLQQFAEEVSNVEPIMYDLVGPGVTRVLTEAVA